ncbi:hypothetical protein [Paraburkholderia adhaesiva]|uniref:hypothetical protein n=1 Tax=Paraburkholderia adhaesiva TaxID=2883244 RepID=UPI001F3630F2|nr:hypothetical protein [Paraburkholderia adhaesiva]
MSHVMSLPLDVTGAAPTNHITDEPYVIGSALTRAFATNYGGFYASSLVIRDVATGMPLAPDQYFLSGIMDLATAKYGRPNDTQIVSIVVVTDAGVSPDVELDYQALGAKYATPQTAIANAIETYEPDTRNVQWPSVIDNVADLPPSQAVHDAGQKGLITFEYVVHAIDRLQQLALMGDPVTQDEVRAYADRAKSVQSAGVQAQLALLDAHEADTDNPHELTPAQLQAMTRSQQDAAILTETSARIAADASVEQTLDAHTTNYGNPHQTTLAQVDMYSVAQANSQITTARNGVNAVLALNVGAMNAHINNTDNPHQTTPAELETLSASDISTAISLAASAVSSDTAATLVALNTHISNTANPHEVTPDQLGTWSAAQLQSLAGTVSAHTVNYANPHADTVAAISGMASTAIDSAISAALSSLLSYYSNNNSAMVGHINNLNNPHQVSAQAIGCVGPWNNLAGDLNNAQAQITNSVPVINDAVFSSFHAYVDRDGYISVDFRTAAWSGYGFNGNHSPSLVSYTPVMGGVSQIAIYRSVSTSPVITSTDAGPPLSVTLTQAPNASNDWTAIVYINDNPQSGAHNYYVDVHLTCTM